ncbi:hypothetical protein Ancab_025507 [Ancistrocladus abbreviatus]
MLRSPSLHSNSFLTVNPSFPHLPLLSHLTFYKPTAIHTPPVSAHHHRTNHQSCLAQLPEPPTASTNPAASDAFTPQEDGPIELPPETPSIFATTDNPSPIQVATSVLLTGAVSVFLFRSIRRRAKRAKELRFRTSGAKKALNDEAMDNLKAIGAMTVEPGSSPSPAQALLGGLTAGVIALILYKFTTTIEAALNRQTMSDNFSVRQITITVRTIINGLCYLATFVFGINSIGLFLYSGQLAINALFEGSTSKATRSEGEKKPNSSNSSSETQMSEGEISSSEDDKSSDVDKK